MMRPVLVTGSRGLIGSALLSHLRAQGMPVREYDLRVPEGQPGRCDVRDYEALQAAVRDCSGVVHLAAVSRVEIAQRDPALCWSTNVEGTGNLLNAIRNSGGCGWVILASSREVYGQPTSFPVDETHPIRPINVYGASKASAEQILYDAPECEARVAVARLSNVYGSVSDHADRVIPAFVRAAVRGDVLRVEGAQRAFDFTNVEDVVQGLFLLMKKLQLSSHHLAPIQLVSGKATSLLELAQLAVEVVGRTSRIVMAPGRTYDVSAFWGNPKRAEDALGWRSKIQLRDGVLRLAEEFIEVESSGEQVLSGAPPDFRAA